MSREGATEFILGWISKRKTILHIVQNGCKKYQLILHNYIQMVFENHFE